MKVFPLNVLAYSISYELPAGINYHQIIGTHIRDNIYIKPIDCGKFHVTHYKLVTKGVFPMI